MISSNEKGAALERASRAIEDMLIRAHPGLAQTPFSIEPNVILVKDGVRHEIDFLVRINKGSPYETLHFFECKNQRKPVGKNDVIVFSEKVKALGAAKGTLVGRDFTKHAKAQAGINRIELARFDDSVWPPIPSFSFTGSGHNFSNCTLQLTRRSGTPETPPPPSWLQATCNWKNQRMSLSDFATYLATKWLNDTKVFDQPNGKYSGCGNPTYEFDPGELIIGPWDVQTIVLSFEYSVSLMPMPPVSSFSIEKRGRFARFECLDDVSGIPITVEVVAPPPN